MKSRPIARNQIVTGFMIFITLIGLVMIASDWTEIRAVLAEADWHVLFGGILFTAFSYTAYSYGYALVSQLLGIRMGKRELAEVCFISTVINHVLTSGGVVGYSLRYLLMKMYGVSLKDTLTSSMLHYYLTSLDMLIFLPITYVYLMTHAAVPRGIAISLGIMIIMFGLVLFLLTALVLFPSRRSPIIDLLARLGRSILRRDYQGWLTQMDETFTLGTRAMLHHPLRFVGIMTLTLIDFVCSIAVLGFCFDAFGPPVPASILTTGYVIGIMAGLLSMIPGGFGVQEGSMTGIFVLLGVPFEQAILAVILFRILYYLLPYCLILLFYNRLLHKAKQAELIAT